ncbi:MAG: dihydroxyacetone kinase subunit DhaL [Kiritimatiellaceae bacterium]|nr:dihydroxyacetone kinase subunit DhaL [Kiritimatiellaceae bacterium]
MPKFTKQNMADMLTKAATVIEHQHAGLSKLDAATGDGDHGVTINRTMKAVRAAVEESTALPLADLMKNVAMKVMMCDGGSTSPLLGSYFMGFANAAPSDELDNEQTATFFEAALTNFYGISKAEPGDKTMMDALRPATETLAAELRAGKEIQEAFSAAASAAAEGAEKTKEYVAKFGRARTMGERAIGHKDAGATSFALIFDAFSKAI